MLCQNFIGHRTHASLLEHYLRKDETCVPDVRRFSVADLPAMSRFPLRILGHQAPQRVRSIGLDMWPSRSLLIQGHLANRAIRAAAVASDVVYVHSHSAGRVVHLLDGAAPVVVSLDGTYRAESRMLGRQPLFSDHVGLKMERSMFERADLIVAFSEWARASVINDYGIAAEKTRTIRNAVESTAPFADEPRWEPRTDLPLIGFVGDGFHRKGGDILLEAHQRHLSATSHLVIVTNDAIKTDGLKNVTVLKPMARNRLLASVLPKFAVYVHPARKDWSPYSVIEALSAGLPIVASTVGSIPEMVFEGRNGYLLDRPSPATLTEAIGAILDDGMVATRMGLASRAIFEERHDAERNYPLLVQTLKSQQRGSIRQLKGSDA